VWLYIVAMNVGNFFSLRLTDSTFATTIATSAPATAIGQWIKIPLLAQNLTAFSAGVRLLLLSNGTPGTIDFVVDAFSMNEGPDDISDVEYSGGTKMVQAAHTKLAATSTPVTGYDLSAADFETLDAAYSDDLIVEGASVETIDTDLGTTTTFRIQDFTRDLLKPGVLTSLRLGAPPVRALQQIAQALIAA
jgi:hypothetical protein